MKNYNRRDWLYLMTLANAGVLLPNLVLSCGNQKTKKLKGSTTETKRIKTMLVVSGWQDVNIGDIAHTPGLLHILETFMPDTEIILWKRSVGEEVKKLLQKNFPKVKIIYGNVDAAKNVDNPEVLEAFDKAEIMVHGSGPFVVGRENLQAWIKHSSKPYGIFGVTIEKISDEIRLLLESAAFIFTRETKSLDVLKENGFEGDHISFAPDATFFMDILDETRAQNFLKSNGLEDKKFICAIPRLRKTPYYKIRPNNAGWSDEKIREVDELNEAKKEVDHAKMREAIIAWVRETGNKVLVCPEMTYQVDIMNELLIDPLPEDVKPFVIKRGYWMPDEAASIYTKAHTVLSFECHSPIISLTNGTPTLYLRQPEDTIKGQMYYDLGLSDWVFEIEETEGSQIVDRLREIWTNYDKAKEKVVDTIHNIDEIYSLSVKEINGLG